MSWNNRGDDLFYKKKAKVHVLSGLFAAVATSFVFAFALSFALHSCSGKNISNNIFIKDSVSPAYIGKRYQNDRIDKIHEHNTILINMYMFTWPHAEKMESISCSILVHKVARHAAVLPGAGMAARPGPPALEWAA